MASEVDIANRALLKVHANPISRLRPPEDSEESQACFTVYDQLLDEVLAAHPWNFAIKQVALNKLDVTPIDEFTFAYQLPNDCLRVLRIQKDKYRYRYKIKGDQLHTDLDGVKIEYISRVLDTTKFDPMFVSTLAIRIAAELAYPIAGSTERTQQLMVEYKDMLREAKRRDGQEGTPDPITAETFIDSRQQNGYSHTKYW